MGTFKVVLTFESVDEILRCDYSNETSSAVLLHGTICFVEFGVSLLDLRRCPPMSSGKNLYACHFKGKYGKLYIFGKVNKVDFRKNMNCQFF